MGAAPPQPVYAKHFAEIERYKGTKAPANATTWYDAKPIALPAGLGAAPDLTEVAVRAARQASSLKLTAGQGRKQSFLGAAVTPPKSLLGG